MSEELSLARQIRRARVAAGLSQGELENRIGQPGQGVISRYERGERAPSVEVLGRIALVLGTVFVIHPAESEEKS